MPNQIIRTDREKEAIYEYSTNGNSVNIAGQPEVTIELFFNAGNRKLKITEQGNSKEYSLDPPKKPTGTPSFIVLDGIKFEIE